MAEKDRNPHFGGCPECGCTHGYLNLGRHHWFVCDDHKTRWYVGSNIFSSWHNETEENQAELWQRVAHYREVKSIHAAPADEPQTRQPLKYADSMKGTSPESAVRMTDDPDDLPTRDM